MIGLPEAKWEEKEMGIQKQEEYTTHESRQRTLSEFMSQGHRGFTLSLFDTGICPCDGFLYAMVMPKVLFENGNKCTAKVIGSDHCTQPSLKLLTNATTTKGRAAGSYT